MKFARFVFGLLIAVALTACTSPQASSTQSHPAPPATVAGNDEVEVRNLVERFGKRLQNVSLLSPDATQEIKEQYSEFVSADLLDLWVSDVSKAPGRMVSSPWPDRIEITRVERESPDKYMVSGFIIEVTSTEVINGGAAAEISVHIVAKKLQDHWMITGYSEER